ncbi:MAG TPA: hypothetical protein VFT78_03565 [Hanamia sp.]|nr:hypothetical protein [Hanamia sp.]
MRKNAFSQNSCLIAFTALVLLFLCGCKKDHLKYYYISYEANGVRHVDTSYAFAGMYANDTTHSYSAELVAHNSSSGDLIEIIILLKTPLNTTTVYKDTTQTFGTLVDISYYDSPYSFPGNPKMSSYKLFPRNVMIRFTNISATKVEGIFSGTIASSYNSPVTSITNGEFYLKVH